MNLRQLLKIPTCRLPNACALVNGSPKYPNIHGEVCFYQTSFGVIVTADIRGLPHEERMCPADIFGFHIHESGPCAGNSINPFADVGSHYNPMGCPHPAHAGDLPPLFGNSGTAFMSFLTDRFIVNEIHNRSVIIHASPDDFTTQPSGNSGEMIACGQILKYSRRKKCVRTQSETGSL